MTGIPPGIIFILRQLPSVLLPLGGTYATIIFTRQHLHLDYPSWLDAVATLALQPVFLVVKSGLATLTKRRKAISMGAVTLPQVSGNSFYIVKTVMASFRDGYIGLWLVKLRANSRLIAFHSFYIGDCFDKWSKQYGNTYQTQAFGSTNVSTLVSAVGCPHIMNFYRSLRSSLNTSRSIEL
jgi:hypothetical protein